MIIAVPKYIRACDFPPPTSGFVMCEFIRLIMKMHSFLVRPPAPPMRQHDRLILALLMVAWVVDGESFAAH
jgi:hypothetical protein